MCFTKLLSEDIRPQIWEEGEDSLEKRPAAFETPVRLVVASKAYWPSTSWKRSETLNCMKIYHQSSAIGTLAKIF